MNRLQSATATLLGALALLSACSSSDTVCHGNADLCHVPFCSPHFFLKTSDGLPSIASASVLTGECSLDDTKVDIGVSDGGQQGLASVRFYAQAYYCSANPPPCVVQVMFTNGDTTTITAERFQGLPFTYSECEGRPSNGCCDRSQYKQRTIYECGFVQSEFIVGTPAAIDGGTAVDS